MRCSRASILPSLRPSTVVQGLIPEANGWIVSAGSQSDHFDAVIIAAPAHAAASVLQSANDALARELAAINYSSSITVTLGYDEKVRRSLPPGFGFLIPHSAGHRMLAATFVHNKFPHRAPENRAIVRCFLGGARDEAILDYSDDQILQIVRDELRGIIALNAEPLFARVYKWRSAMAQYSVGHLDRLAAHQVPLRQTSRPRSRRQRLQRNRRSRLRSLRQRSGQQSPRWNGTLIRRSRYRRLIARQFPLHPLLS